MTAPPEPVAPEQPSRFRPGVRAPRRVRWGEVGGTAGLLLVLTAALLNPILADPLHSLLGDPDTDAIRGMWGFDHVARSLLPPNTPIWSGEVNFPHGVLAVILPFSSAALLSPLNAVFGPIGGYNASIVALFWMAGLATAGLVRHASGSWPAGAVAGAAFLSQPMLLAAMADGTPEHVAVWGIPALLLFVGLALDRRTPLWGAAAGAMALVVALDGPYNAIFAAVLLAGLGPAGLVTRLRQRHTSSGLGWTILSFGVAAGLGAVLVALLYSNFPLGEQEGLEQARLLQMNAADVHTWWQFDFGPTAERDPSLAPTLIPTTVLVASLVLSLARLRQAGPWLAVGLLSLCLAFGWNANLPKELAQWLGGVGTWVGNWVLTINVRAYSLPAIESIRFPRRFLIPASLALLTAGGVGLGRLMTQACDRGPRWRAGTWVVAVVLASLAVQQGRSAARLSQTAFPLQPLPEVAFTSWLRTQPGPGAVITLPQMRAAPRSGKRSDLPVFANIAESLSSADVQYLQVLHQRPVVGYPSLKTLVPMRINADIHKLGRNWDDLAHPLMTGNVIPRSAYDETGEPRRQATIEWLRRRGLRFVVVDRSVYNDESFSILLEQLKPHLKQTQSFEDGAGVTILELIQ